mgnify:CR=1 FL=1
MNLQRRDKKRLNKLFPCIAGSLLFGLVTVYQLNTIEKVQRNTGENKSNIQLSTADLQQHLKTLKIIPTLGFRNLLANATFLNFLQYFSDVSEQKIVSRHLSFEFFDTIITLDPFYRDYYLFLSESTTFYAAQPEKSIELMAMGLERIDPGLVSDSFYIWRYKGVDELLFLGDGESARQSFENAASWARHSNRADSDLIGRVSQQTADFLKQNPDSRYAQIAAWQSVLATSANEDIRKRAAQKIQDLTEAENTVE